jgi:hypothetical protein
MMIFVSSVIFIVETLESIKNDKPTLDIMHVRGAPKYANVHDLFLMCTTAEISNTTGFCN